MCLGKHFLMVVQSTPVLTVPETLADASVTMHGCLKMIRMYAVSMPWGVWNFIDHLIYKF